MNRRVDRLLSHWLLGAVTALCSAACGSTVSPVHDQRREAADPDVAGAEGGEGHDGPGAAGTSPLADGGVSTGADVDAPRDRPDDAFGSRPLPASRGEAIPAEGECALRTGPGFGFGDHRALAFVCRMRSATATGPTADAFPLVDGDRGRAVMSGGDLVLRCGTSDEVLFEAVIRCFEGQGHGVYVIAPGDLKLGAQRSDRRCEIAMGVRDDAVSGAIACDDAPADPSNLFANTWLATGPGTFELPRTSH